MIMGSDFCKILCSNKRRLWDQIFAQNCWIDLYTLMYFVEESFQPYIHK